MVISNGDLISRIPRTIEPFPAVGVTGSHAAPHRHSEPRELGSWQLDQRFARKGGELSGAVRKSERVTLGNPVEPVADRFLG